MVPPQLEKSWKEALKEEFNKPYLDALAVFLAEERGSGVPIYPPKQDVFNAFKYSPYEQTQVVLVGQDPYHGPLQAHGLSFSVPKGVPTPPSLKNIFKELESDLGIPAPAHGCLMGWTEQGVLLLNAVLTVRQGEPGSHAKKGWERFTDAVILQLCKRRDPVIFVLWGKYAEEKGSHILHETHAHHFVLKAPHPSPFSAHSGFFGSHHFSKINKLLTTQGKRPIDWGIK